MEKMKYEAISHQKPSLALYQSPYLNDSSSLAPFKLIRSPHYNAFSAPHGTGTTHLLLAEPLEKVFSVKHYTC